MLPGSTPAGSIRPAPSSKPRKCGWKNSANAVIHAGAAPKFADVDPQTYTIDAAKVKSAMDDRTRAVIPVHVFGFPVAMDELCELASEHDIAVVEDACQAHGASYKNRMTGSIGDVGCFSFYPSKNMTVGGDGGMIVSDDEAVAGRVTSLRDCGRVKGSKYVHDKIGFTSRLNTVQAAIGRVQLQRLDGWNEKRRRVASEYDELLSDLGEVVEPPHGDHDSNPVYHLYVIRCRHRDHLRSWLAQKGIETGIHYPDPIHLQPIYRAMFGFQGGEFPISEAICRDVLSIPMYPDLSDDEVRFVSDSIHAFYGKEAQQR
jgi:perosamine synthetase